MILDSGLLFWGPPCIMSPPIPCNYADYYSFADYGVIICWLLAKHGNRVVAWSVIK